MKQKPLKSVNFESGYFNEVWNPVPVAKRMKEQLKDVEYDTIVGTGLSGGLIVPYLAREFHKRALIVRKKGASSHSSSMLEGRLGTRWLFVDDFTESGESHDRVEIIINTYAARHNNERTSFETTHVGDYYYHYDELELHNGEAEQG